MCLLYIAIGTTAVVTKLRIWGDNIILHLSVRLEVITGSLREEGRMFTVIKGDRGRGGRSS
jgi:hypothetical protein